ncbi:MAG: 6-bladed beta-propeller [Balneolaceae bacterium]|nr:6-bladed beta-propeller [Balneolaceae bacterium]MCH8548033.1 6-bladed beta-propeller [Balneolaceae bacterium]
MRLLITITICFHFFACSSEQDSVPLEDVKTIQVDLNDAEDLNMSQFFSSVEYHPLVTPDDKQIGRITKTMVLDEYFGFYDEARNSVWVFTRDFEYVNEVRIPQGRGPGEVIQMTDAVLTNDGLVHALGAYNMVIYNLEGELVDEALIDLFITKIAYDESSQEYIGYASNHLNRELNGDYSGHNLIYFDRSGTVTGGELPIENGRQYIAQYIPNRFSAYNDYDLVSPALIDTVYSIYNGSIEPRYYLDFGDDSIPEEVFNLRDSYASHEYDWANFFSTEIDGNNYIGFLSMFNETDAFIHFRFGTREQNYNAIYNKETEEISIGSGLMVNDIDYGFVHFNYQSFDDALFTIVEPSDLLYHLNDLAENAPEKLQSSKMRDLIELADSIDEDGDPILKILPFK